jgi:hypothetical protein
MGLRRDHDLPYALLRYRAQSRSYYYRARRSIGECAGYIAVELDHYGPGCATVGRPQKLSICVPVAKLQLAVSRHRNLYAYFGTHMTVELLRRDWHLPALITANVRLEPTNL